MVKSNGFGPKKAYLILYNAVSAIAWATILGRVAVVLGWKGSFFVPLVVDNFARITQTCAVMEILHALTGAYPSSHKPPFIPNVCTAPATSNPHLPSAVQATLTNETLSPAQASSPPPSSRPSCRSPAASS